MCIRFEMLLSTETSLFGPTRDPRPPPTTSCFRVVCVCARAVLLKVILRGPGGVGSHDLAHVTFLGANIKAAIFLCPGSPTQTFEKRRGLARASMTSGPNVGPNWERKQLRLFRARPCHRDRGL